MIVDYSEITASQTHEAWCQGLETVYLLAEDGTRLLTENGLPLQAEEGTDSGGHRSSCGCGRSC